MFDLSLLGRRMRPEKEERKGEKKDSDTKTKVWNEDEERKTGKKECKTGKKERKKAKWERKKERKKVKWERK